MKISSIFITEHSRRVKIRGISVRFWFTNPSLLYCMLWMRHYFNCWVFFQLSLVTLYFHIIFILSEIKICKWIYSYFVNRFIAWVSFLFRYWSILKCFFLIFFWGCFSVVLVTYCYSRGRLFLFANLLTILYNLDVYTLKKIA